MGSSDLVKTFLLTVLGAACAMGTVDDMGPCRKIKTIERFFNFDQFAQEAGGSWHYQLVPNVTFFDRIQYAGVQFKPTGKAGVYNINIYNILKNGKRETFSDGRVTYLGNGHAINNATETGEGNIAFEYSYIKYEPECFLFYHVCTKEGGDKTTDYRNVLVHQPLGPEKIKSLMELDKSLGFKNDLMILEVQPKN